jgi:tripartite-type tricarboxylate transporter receptor subunit TctC
MKNLIFAIVALLFAFTPAAAQNWPMRPVTMVVPSAAGGAFDVMGHVLAPRLSELLGQPLIVENVAGAGGMTGAALVAKSAPDGYHFVLGTGGTHAKSQRNRSTTQ